jgi:putative transposase
LAGEAMKKQDQYLGKRVKRGLFQSSIGKLLNADVNGAIGIGLKKVRCNSFVKKIVDSGFVFNPYSITIT